MIELVVMVDDPPTGEMVDAATLVVGIIVDAILGVAVETIHVIKK